MAYSAEDHRAMAEALRLAAKGLYTTRPNPRVGCVVLRDGEIVGRGWHRRAGEAHAEVLALQQAGEHARGATVYVTLEPCVHQGRTPPCVDALLAAGVARVVAAVSDSNPRVAGLGCARLNQEGVQTSVGLMQQQAVALNPGFFRRHETGRPWVRVKLAMSLDGRTAMASGESKWITGAAARRDVQSWRARSCALLTGVGTVLADDPRLSIRAEDLPESNAEPPAMQPLRVVLDSGLRTPPTSRLFRDAPVLLLSSEQALAAAGPLQDAGAEVVALPSGPGGLDLEAALTELGRREVNEVQVEAGAALSGQLFRSGLVDELLLYVAPRLLGSSARPLLELPVERMCDALDLEVRDIRQLGEDQRIRAVPKHA